MSTDKKVAILGAGFSGLTLAWYLSKQGLAVEVFESADRVGGLIQTSHKSLLVENAAHAILASADVEELFKELNLQPEVAGFKSRSKWIFRNSAKRWPLSFSETFQSIINFLKFRLHVSNKLNHQQSLLSWAHATSLTSFTNFLLGPALQGVYGASSEKLSASLILGNLFRKDLRLRKGNLKGSLAPKLGMQKLIDQLAEQLQKLGVKIHLDSKKSVSNLQDHFDAVVVATSLKSASQELMSITPILAGNLQQLPSVSLATVTLGLKTASNRIQGFGCLFPASENFNSLGVLFNSDLFSGRGDYENETWILNQNALDLSDDELLQAVLKDRKKLDPKPAQVETFTVRRLPNALPLYGIELESFLNSRAFLKKTNSNLFSCLDVFYEGARLSESQGLLYLTGNYLGGIGLTKILAYNRRLAERMRIELCEAI